MRPLRDLTWAAKVYFCLVILLGAALVPVSLILFPIADRNRLLMLLYLAVFTQVAAFMPIKWRRGTQTVDTMPLTAASLLAPGVGPALLSWLCKFDGRRPSAELPLWPLLFNRAKSAIEFGLPSIAIALVPLPDAIDVPAKALLLALGSLLIGHSLTAQVFALYERDSFWRVFAANVGMDSVRSILILCVGGGVLYMVLQLPAGYFMGVGLLGLLLAVRLNMADAQRQHVERIQTLELMAQALDARDPMTELHSQRVSNLAVQIAQALGMSNLEVERIRVAGLLHDIGKIGVPDSVLKKPAALEPGEWALMRRHADVGADMIGRHSALQPIAPWVRYHHERWNGTGYPSGLSGTEIPLGARILAVADSFDTITGPRVYRKSSMGLTEAVDDISAAAGILYDVTVVNALRQVYGVPMFEADADTRPDARSDSAHGLDLIRTNSRLRFLGAGMTISNLGDPLTTIAVAVSSFATTHSGLGVGLALALRAAAMMTGGALLGGAVDRLSRRRLIIAADIAQCAMLVTTPALLLMAPWTLFGTVVVLGVASALGQAGRDASVTEVVQPSQLPSANGLIGTGVNAARTAGYPIAAALIWLGSSTTPLYLLDAATFLGAAGLTLLAGPLGGGIKTSKVTGAFRTAFTLPGVRLWLIAAGICAFLMSATTPALIVLAYQLTSDGPKAYTFFEVVLAAGMLLGALIVGTAVPKARSAVLAGLVLMGVLSVATAASSILLLTAGLLLMASVGNQLYVIGNRTQLQQLAPTDRVGSVMATRGVLAGTLAVLGSAAGGIVSSALGGRLTYGIAGAGLMILALALTAVTATKIRAGAPSHQGATGGAEPVILGSGVEVAKTV